MSLPNSKPFSIQSPDTLIELSGGNKQKLLQMVQAGSIDQTSAVLAAMKIDKIRAAAQIEQAPQQTVMQKTFGLGAPPVPQAPQAAPTGLGATPQGMQMAGGPGPQMAAPPQMIPPAPQGPVRMAVGGLTTLPIPDDMYDERTFAGGGIVAFSPGGSTYDNLLAKAAELEADANSGKHSGYRRDALLTQARQLKQQARSAGLREAAPSFGASLSNLIPDYFQTPDVVAQRTQDNKAYGDRIKAINQATGSPVAPPAPEPSRTSIPRAEGIPFMSARNPARTPAPAAVVPPPAPLGDRGVVGAPRAPAGSGTPEDDYGLPKAPGEFNRQNVFDEILKMQGAAPGMEKMSAEEKAADRNYDAGMALFAAASRGLSKGSKTFLGALGDAGEGAMPALTESAKERRAETKEERKAELERQRLEYGARGTAAAATRAEETAMRTYGLNLAEAKAKIANDKATLALEIKKANALASYYSKAGRDRDAAMVNRLSNALQRIAKNPNDEEAIAERDAIQQLQGRGLGLNRGKLTPDQALRQATNETKSFDFVLPKDMTVQQYIDARKLELMGSGGGVSNPEIDDIVNQYT